MNTLSLHRTVAAGFWLGTIMLAISPDRAAAQFLMNNTALYAHIPLSGFAGAPANGNDCWGYVSPSGREYALMGLSNCLAVVEITNPASPIIVSQISHTNSLWAGVKVYQNYCYVSNESGGGIDVIDLSQVDSGIVTLVQRMTTDGLSTTHTVALNPVSGYLYLAGSNIGGGRLMAYSLANPANPTFAGQVNSTNGTYNHESQVVSYTSGPYAGREIAFSCNGGIGLDIYDVTDKANMFRVSRTTYGNLSYCHQGWLSGDRKYFYINDETDGINETVIMDVGDITAPVVAGTVSAGDSATDHNLYIRDDFIYEADYRGGARIYCAADPLHPVQVGFFDTFPTNNASGYNGAWSLFPFFPSGTLIISDIEGGLFIVDVSDALSTGSIGFEYPSGRPGIVDPDGGTLLEVNLAGACGATIEPGSALLHYNTGGGWSSVSMTETASDSYQVAFPSTACGTEISYYVTAQANGGVVIADPSGAPSSTYSVMAATDIDDIFADHFETDLGWTTSVIGATSGQWQRGVPVNDPAWEYAPATDGDGSGQCWLTQNALGNTDVDGGSVQLISPTLDLTSGNLTLAYSYYLRLTVADGVDRLLVEISSNGTSGPWTQIALYTDSSGVGSTDHLGSIWTHEHLSDTDIAALGVTLTNNMRVRFTANDSGTASIVEAGIDGVEVHKYLCELPSCLADLNNSGGVGVPDLLTVVNSWGLCAGCPADLAPPGGNGSVGVPDLLFIINNWGPCQP